MTIVTSDESGAVKSYELPPETGSIERLSKGQFELDKVNWPKVYN